VRVLIEAYREFLQKQDVLPMENWNVFISEHQIPMQPNVKNHPHTMIMRQQGKDTDGGVYVYFDNETCLYIGESKVLGSRFKDHYNASWKTNHKLHQFFSRYRKPLTVRWIKIENVFDRRTIEAMLTRIYKPTYIDFKT